MPKEITDPQILNDAVEALLRLYRHRDRDRGTRTELSFDEFKTLILSPCVYCGTEAKNGMKSRYKERFHDRWFFFRNTIDRVDSAKGYVSGNCVSCCFVCNKSKGDQPVLNWLRWIHRCAENTKNWPQLHTAPLDSLQMSASEVRHVTMRSWYRPRGGV